MQEGKPKDPEKTCGSKYGSGNQMHIRRWCKEIESPCDSMGLFKSFVMNNKAFRNFFCNPQKSFHTSPTRIIEAVNHFSNSTIAFIKILQLALKCFVNAIVEFEEWLTASIIRDGRFRRGVKTLLWITQ